MSTASRLLSSSSRKAVLLMNPRSGGGKVERFELVAEAKRRGIEPVLLGPDDDLRTLAREAAKLVSLEALRQIGRFDGWAEWSADSFQVDSGSPVAAGIDGESVVLDPPLRFTISPSALRVLLPPSAVGLSPAAVRPNLSGSTLRELWGIATARR